MCALRLLVIGGGPVGIAAAMEAARISRRTGSTVTLVAETPIGGRAGWHSLVPSKVLLHAAAEHAGRGLMQPAALAELLGHVEQTAQRYSAVQARALRDARVELVTGKAVFALPTRVVIEPPGGGPVDVDDTARQIEFDRVIVASGSVPVFPPHLKPDGKRIIAPRFVRKLQRLPETMCVVGGGVTGAEFVYAFAALGVKVSWLVDQFGVLPPFDRKPVQALVKVLGAMGVELIEGQATSKLEPDPAGTDERGVIATLADGRTVKAEQAFVAIGRKPDVDGLHLEYVGLAPATSGPARGGIAVDEHARSAVEHVFAAGDVTGAPLVVNKGCAQAWTAARIALKHQAPPLNPGSWVQAVYSQPQIAQVGTSPEKAHMSGVKVRVQTIPYDAVLKTHLAHEADALRCFVEIAVGETTDRVLGATAFGPDAAEVLTPIAVAIQAGATATQLAATFPAHPSLSELATLAAR